MGDCGVRSTSPFGQSPFLTADLRNTVSMSGVLEFLRRPLVLVAVGTIMLLVAVGAFVSGGRGILTAVVLTVAGGRSAWRGFTKWRAESEPT